uniref:Polyprotein protein n=1 Tax=Solanum tuberosum TaxID=4113 RepID=M1DVM6_SOLTU
MVSSLLVTLRWYLSVGGGMGRYPYIAQGFYQNGIYHDYQRKCLFKHGSCMASILSTSNVLTPFVPFSYISVGFGDIGVLCLKDRFLRCLKMKTRLSWVQLERVNHKPFSTRSTRDIEWTKAYAVLNFYLLVFERNQLDSGLKCRMCLKSAGWPEKGPVSDSQKRSDLRATTSERDDDELLSSLRAELCSKRLDDQSRIRTTQTTTSPPAPAQAIVLAPPVQGLPPQFMNILKAEEALGPQEKKPTAKFKPVDYVVVRGRKMMCDVNDINAVMECLTRIKDDYQYKIKTKTLENMKKWLAPLIYNGTPKWLIVGAPIEKKDLNMATRGTFAYSAPGTSGISSTASSMTLNTSTAPLPPRSGTVVAAVSRPPLNQAALLRMGQLAHSPDRRASRLEATISGMIERALVDCVTPLSSTIDAIAKRIAVKSTDISMIFGTVEIPDMPVDPVMPLATTEDEVRTEKVAVTKSEAETDEEQMGVVEEASY